jgi:hypothetical protein
VKATQSESAIRESGKCAAGRGRVIEIETETETVNAREETETAMTDIAGHVCGQGLQDDPCQGMSSLNVYAFILPRFCSVGIGNVIAIEMLMSKMKKRLMNGGDRNGG